MDTQERCDTIREKWLAGWSDRDIGSLVHLSERSVRTQRYQLGLTVENYPLRKPLHGRTSYTPEEEQDILTSLDNGVSIRSLAIRYGVNERTINAKITQLQMRKDKPPKIEPSSRVCLRCGLPFVSPLPKSINRICGTCRNEADWSPLI